MPHLHTHLHSGVLNRYANVAFTTFAQIYSSLCTNLQIWGKSIFSCILEVMFILASFEMLTNSDYSPYLLENIEI